MFFRFAMLSLYTLGRLAQGKVSVDRQMMRWYDVVMNEGTLVVANTDIENEFWVAGTADDVIVDTVKAGTPGVVRRVIPGMDVWVLFADHPEIFRCSAFELDIDNDD